MLCRAGDELAVLPEGSNCSSTPWMIIRRRIDHVALAEYGIAFGSLQFTLNGPAIALESSLTAALSSYFVIDPVESSKIFITNMMALQTPNSSDPDDLGAWDASYEILVSLYKARTIKSKVDTWELPMISNASFQFAFQDALATNISVIFTNFTLVTVQPLTAAEAQVYQGQNSSPWRQLFGTEARLLHAFRYSLHGSSFDGYL